MKAVEKASTDRIADWRPDRLEHLEERARKFSPVRVAVVYPVDGPSLNAALESRNRRLIKPVLVGPEEKIKQAAKDLDAGLGKTPIIAADTPEEAAGVAVDLAISGKVDGL